MMMMVVMQETGSDVHSADLTWGTGGKTMPVVQETSSTEGAVACTFHKLPHIQQATTTEQHETGESLKKAFRRLNYTPHIPQATAHLTSYYD